jgi:hypothetical protein
MASRDKSRWIPLGMNRALVLDTLHFARQVPVFPVEAEFDLGEVAALRACSARRISWAVLFLKAFSLVAREHAELRRAYVRWPWPHLVETPDSVAMIAIAREFQGEDRLCWGRFLAPENESLCDLQSRLDRYLNEPVESAFAKQVLLSRFPSWLRRMLMGWTLNVAGNKRASRVGTYSLSTLAGQGMLNRGHPSILTTSLTYGPMDEHGQMLVTLLCDHRVLDGAAAARALNFLRDMLCGQMADELRPMQVRRAA